MITVGDMGTTGWIIFAIVWIVTGLLGGFIVYRYGFPGCKIDKKDIQVVWMGGPVVLVCIAIPVLILYLRDRKKVK